MTADMPSGELRDILTAALSRSDPDAHTHARAAGLDAAFREGQAAKFQELEAMANAVSSLQAVAAASQIPDPGGSRRFLL